MYNHVHLFIYFILSIYHFMSLYQQILTIYLIGPVSPSNWTSLIKLMRVEPSFHGNSSSQDKFLDRWTDIFSYRYIYVYILNRKVYTQMEGYIDRLTGRNKSIYIPDLQFWSLEKSRLQPLGEHVHRVEHHCRLTPDKLN